MTRVPLWIKICANTSLADSLLAARAGADAVGFVFAPSARRVTVEQVAAIVPQLPAEIEKIGVFVNTPFEEIAATAENCGLTGVQLHWDAPVELVAQIRERFGPGMRIVRTIHLNAKEGDVTDRPAHNPGMQAAVASGGQEEHVPEGGGGFNPHMSRVESTGLQARVLADPPASLAPEVFLSDPLIDAILIDSRTATATGGTGRTFDWHLAAATLLRDAGERRFIAAGGLTPENVAEAIATLHPWGVDVASGVEAAPGRKDPARLQAFIRNAKAARSAS